MADEPKSIPTASGDMLQPTSMSSRNQLTNGAITKLHKSNRIRSKSESHSSQEHKREFIGVVVKSAKDRAHDRKPKNLKGNGKPKKAGGGGKGTWGKNGEVYEEETHDPDDPNFDAAEKQEDLVLQEVTPDLTSAQFDEVVTPIFQEYFEHGLTYEVADSLRELNITHLKHRIAYLAVTLAMEKKGAQRELTSILLSDLYGERVIYEQDLELGFQALLNALNDLKLDTPDATQVLGQFIARCVADDCLNPSFIKEHLEHPSQVQRESLDVANKYLQMQHGLVRLDKVWGCGGGIRPVKKLIKMIVMLLKEFLISRDLAEAERCVMDLDVPHFHHEIVYEAIQIAFENGSDTIIEAIVELLKHFFHCGILTIDQMNSGFQRIFDNMDDIILDIPRAYKHLDTLLDKSCRAGIISLAMRQSAPSRGRKRYVSEGDFGITSTPLVD